MSLIEKPDTPPKLARCSWIKSGRWFYIDDQESYLILYTLGEPSFSPAPPRLLCPLPRRFREPRKWVNVFHQTAGIACHNVNITARFLEPRKKILPLLRDLTEKYGDSMLSSPVPLDTAVEYRTTLSKYGLGVNRDYTLLQEGFYPIDIEFLKKVTSEKFPKDLQDLLAPTPPRRRGWSFLGYKTFGLAVIGPNSD